jgi:hypothetical protein
MDDRRIQSVIDRALSDAGDTAAKQGIAQGFYARRADYAEGYILAQRSHACGDTDLACAQHYMKMRHWVAEVGMAAQPVCLAFIAGYYSFKKALEILNLRKVAAIGDCELPSPAGWDQVWWAMKGVRDGMDDFYADHPDALDSAITN